MAGWSAWWWRPAIGSVAGCTRLTWRVPRSTWADRGCTRPSGTRCAPSRTKSAFLAAARTRCPSWPALTVSRGRRLSAAELNTNISMQLEEFPQATGRLLTELGPEASAADGIEAFVAGAGLAPGPARRARQALRALIEAESADLAERQSLRWMWNEMEYEGHYFGDMPIGGYRRLAEAMAAGVGLRLGVDVAEIACWAG